ncbi:hypothetical protein L218DRAFT_511322 [Marasmius fiardii PR-910]|nr:hypothetical protein L218DRAFT_511322 [Marasmius fiardii PR-910]
MQLVDGHLQTQLSSYIKTFCIEHNKIWRFAKGEGEEGHQEEMEFVIQGVLVARELPPFTEKFSRTPQVKYLKQAVTIGGFGIELFEESIRGIKLADQRLKRSVPAQDSSMELGCVDVNSDGKGIVHLGNRYFTTRRYATFARGGLQEIESSDNIDPNKVLRDAAGNEYVHTVENQVRYFHCYNVSQTSGKIVEIPPVMLVSAYHWFQREKAKQGRSRQSQRFEC